MVACHPCCCFRHSARKALKITAALQAVKGIVTVLVGVMLLLHAQILALLNPDQPEFTNFNATDDNAAMHTFINQQYIIDSTIPVPVVFLSPLSIGLGVYLWFIAAQQRTDVKCRRWRLYTMIITVAYLLFIFRCIIDAVNEDVEILNLCVYFLEIIFNIYLVLVVSQFLGIRSPEPSLDSIEMT